jgi:anti-sigma B factor antagonist
MDATVTEYKRCVVVKASGRIDSDTVPDLEKTFNTLEHSGKFRLVLDMTEVNFVSSKGWWLLIDIQKACKHLSRGELVLACIDPKIRASLRLIGMDTYFKIFDDVLTAVGSF